MPDTPPTLPTSASPNKPKLLDQVRDVAATNESAAAGFNSRHPGLVKGRTIWIVVAVSVNNEYVSPFGIHG
jgi:hypothetical protein